MCIVQSRQRVAQQNSLTPPHEKVALEAVTTFGLYETGYMIYSFFFFLLFFFSQGRHCQDGMNSMAKLHYSEHDFT